MQVVITNIDMTLWDMSIFALKMMVVPVILAIAGGVLFLILGAIFHRL